MQENTPSDKPPHRILEKNPVSKMGECSVCGPVKLKVRNFPDYKLYICINVVRAQSKRAYQKRKSNLPPNKKMPNSTKKKHGLTITEARLFRKNKICAICGDVAPKTKDGRDGLHIDHCHKNNHIRDVLCTNCNRALGLMHDDPQRLKSAAAYLEKHCLPCQ